MTTLTAAQTAVSSEAHTARYFDAIRGNPELLLAFLREMPKGADLHNHLSGSIYAETLIDWAAENGSCVDTKSFALSAPPCGVTKDTVAASQAFADPVLYRAMVDAFSTRNWQTSGQSGHDHFFDAFDKFGAATHGNTGRMLAETASRAASQREVYQEIMLTPGGPELSAAIEKAGWNNDLVSQREALLANGMGAAVVAARKQLDDAEAVRNETLRCNSSQPDPGCHITQRYLFQVLRGLSKEVVFAQLLCGFETASADPRMVGLNMVMPEDYYVPMRDFSLHVHMIQYLKEIYPQVHITLHAGELAPGMVTPEGLRFHIRDSVEIGHAERIGDGVDIISENRAFELLREMAQRNVMVEICLTSNDVILGIRGEQHPLHQYLRFGVPVSLSTDDEGVSRSDMTHEYLRAAQDQGLSYSELRTMARTGLEHAFIDGQSLWSDGRSFRPVRDCAADRLGTRTTSNGCQKFLDTNEKARLQWKLELQFREFESQTWPATARSIREAAH
jgi:adenosine deaminase